ncbi:MAG TPA: tRNA (adenosine(37)-N6)-dimethylallyltransferase MiaA [Candidatus Tumulicola sp.]|nr:tRNA (adenosine(37)-N6)-dimethylallyltransferase MiaA [Candidatus Tumulicola sp.]
MSDAAASGVLLLAGPTGSGKSELAVRLALRYGAEIVGADSRQIYRGMPIGTALPPPDQLAAVAHHCVAFLDPQERYSAARFALDAMAAIDQIRARGKRAIVAGGTGFYLRALAGGVELAPAYDERLRERLAREAAAHTTSFLHEWLAVRDPSRAAHLHPGDRYRVLRALEVALGAPAGRERPLRTLAGAGIAQATIVIDLPLEELDARIEHRTDGMLAGGLVDEAERVGAGAVAATAVGYPQALAYLRGWATRAELRASLLRATRRYARRQRAWFRSERDAVWLAPEAVDAAVREKLGWSANDG